MQQQPQGIIEQALDPFGPCQTQYLLRPLMTVYLTLVNAGGYLEFIFRTAAQQLSQ